MARPPTIANGIDIDSDAPTGGDSALVGDASGDGHVIDEGEDGEDESWDLPGKTDKGAKRSEGRKQGGSVEEGDDDDEEDARLAYSDSDELPPESESQRRSKRAQRNARRREMRTASDAEIATLRAALEEQGKVVRSLVTGQSSLAVNTVASEISQLEGHLRLVNEEKAAAITSNNGADYAKAEEIRDRIIGRLASLRTQKERMDALVSDQEGDNRQVSQTRQQSQVDPRIVRTVESYFDKFCDRFSWFDPDSVDPDCNIVRAVDASLVSQGYQRHTPVFWQQMERTLARDYNLKPGGAGDEEEIADAPQRRTQQRETAMSRGGQRPPTGNGRGAGNGRGGFSLDATRTSLLRDEGLIGDNLSKDDVAKRDRIISAWRKGDESLRKSGVR